MRDFTAAALASFGDLHVTRAAGVLVAVSGGRTVLMEPAAPSPCPLARRMGGAHVSSYITEKVKGWGMFTPARRLLHHSTSVPFGASEMLMRAVRRGALDGAVVACDGIGTFASRSPELVQGTGARMNGLFHTTVYPELARRAASLGALLPEALSAEPDPAAGLRAASSAGLLRVGVTVAGNQAGLMEEIRETAEGLGVEAVLLSVCNSGLSRGESMAASKADIIWACAAGPNLLRAVRGRIRLQLGVISPVFALTQAGVRLVRASILGEGSGILGDGGTLLGTAREVPEGAPAGTVGPLRALVAEGSELPRLWLNGGQVGV